jgi:hypothetical protein
MSIMIDVIVAAYRTSRQVIRSSAPSWPRRQPCYRYDQVRDAFDALVVAGIEM